MDGENDDEVGLEKADQYLNFGFIKGESSIRQMRKMKVISDNDMCHKEKKIAMK